MHLCTNTHVFKTIKYFFFSYWFHIFIILGSFIYVMWFITYILWILTIFTPLPSFISLHLKNSYFPRIPHCTFMSCLYIWPTELFSCTSVSRRLIMVVSTITVLLQKETLLPPATSNCQWYFREEWGLRSPTTSYPCWDRCPNAQSVYLTKAAVSKRIQGPLMWEFPLCAMIIINE